MLIYLIKRAKQWEVDLGTAQSENHLVWCFNNKDTAVLTVDFLRWLTSASRWQPLSLVCNNLNSSDARREVCFLLQWIAAENHRGTIVNFRIASLLLRLYFAFPIIKQTCIWMCTRSGGRFSLLKPVLILPQININHDAPGHQQHNVNLFWTNCLIQLTTTAGLL